MTRKKATNPCFYCGRTCRSRPSRPSRKGNRPGDACTTDHLTPRSRGGTNDPDNVVLACRQCNEDKGDLDLEEFRLVLAYQRGLIEATDALRFPGERR